MVTIKILSEAYREQLRDQRSMEFINLRKQISELV